MKQYIIRGTNIENVLSRLSNSKIILYNIYYFVFLYLNFKKFDVRYVQTSRMAG